MKRLFLVAIAVIGLAGISKIASAGTEVQAKNCNFTNYYNDTCSVVMNGTNYTIHDCEPGSEGDCGFISN